MMGYFGVFFSVLGGLFCCWVFGFGGRVFSRGIIVGYGVYSFGFLIFTCIFSFGVVSYRGEGVVTGVY